MILGAPIAIDECRLQYISVSLGALMKKIIACLFGFTLVALLLVLGLRRTRRGLPSSQP